MTQLRSSFEIAPGVSVGGSAGPLVIAGPCVAESMEICRDVAGAMQKICADLELPYIFKASFDKANRTSVTSFRGPGLERGLEMLMQVKREFDLPVLTDVHLAEQAAPVAEVCDALQIPAFLSRQTDLLVAAGEAGKPVNVKKGQFMAPEDMERAVDKVRSTGNDRVKVTERGTAFGYHNLVVDMRGLVIMAQAGVPVVFDATHSVQLPSGQGGTSGGQREFAFPLTRAAVAVGIQGLFMEVHPRPAEALCDGPNALPLSDVRDVLATVKSIHRVRWGSGAGTCALASECA